MTPTVTVPMVADTFIDHVDLYTYNPADLIQAPVLVNPQGGLMKQFRLTGDNENIKTLIRSRQEEGPYGSGRFGVDVETPIKVYRSTTETSTWHLMKVSLTLTMPQIPAGDRANIQDVMRLICSPLGLLIQSVTAGVPDNTVLEAVIGGGYIK